MARKRGRKVNKKTVKQSVKPKKSKDLGSVDLSKKRVTDWMEDQKKIKRKGVKHVPPTLTDENEDDKFDKELMESSITLKDLSKLPKDEIKYLYFFSCDWGKCKCSFKREIDLYDHVRDHYEEAQQSTDGTYLCKWDLCHFETQEIDHLDRHINYHGYLSVLMSFGESLLQKLSLRCDMGSAQRNTLPIIPNNYLCQWTECPFATASIISYLDHVENHASFEFKMRPPNSKLAITCHWGKCTKSYDNYSRFKEHIRAHCHKKVVACPTCGETFAKNGKLVDHCKRQFVMNQDFQCTQCSKCFATESLLKDHIFWHINRYKCTYCDMSCPTPSNLSRHIRTVHIKAKPFSCVQCPYQCESRRDLIKHLLTHNVKLLECAVYGCNFTCSTLYMLKKHYKDHYEERPVYKCHCCEKEYTRGNYLSRHLIKDHNFQRPSGHSKFHYQQSEDGYFRLQTARIESLDVIHQIMRSQNKRMTRSTQKTEENMKKSAHLQITDYDDKENRLHVSIVPDDDNPIENTTNNETDDEVDCNRSDDMMSKSDELPEDDDLEDRLDLSSDNIDFLVDNDAPIKKIDDFVVMKKYLNRSLTAKNKNITIEINDVDGDGKVIKSQVSVTSEI